MLKLNTERDIAESVSTMTEVHSLAYRRDSVSLEWQVTFDHK
jgi:hypothetical protein